MMSRNIMNVVGVSLAIYCLAIACKVDEPAQRPEESTGEVFYAINGDMVSTKTVLNANGTIHWLPNEKISLSYGPEDFGYGDVGGTPYISENSLPSGKVAFVREDGNTLPRRLEDGKVFWAIYPFRNDNVIYGDKVDLVLPHVQTALAETFDNNFFPSIARSKDFTLHFFNVCGGLKFRVSEPGVKSVVFRGNAGEPVAGKVKLGWNTEERPVLLDYLDPVRSVTLEAPQGSTLEVGKWYYIALVPGTLAKGYDITLKKENGTSVIKTNEKPVTIKRAVWGVLEDLDKGISYEVQMPHNEIWYTTDSGQPLGYEGRTYWRDRECFTVQSDMYSDGIGKLVFDRNLDEVFMYMFQGKDLTSIQIPEGVCTISYGAFHRCSNLSSVQLPSTLESIGELSFAETGLNTVSFPQNLKTIGEEAFFWSTIREADLPKGLLEIGHAAFYMCAELSAVTIPSTVRKIGGAAFERCPKLTRLDILATVPPTCKNDAFGNPYDFYFNDKYPIYVPTGTAQAYSESSGYKDCLFRMFTQDGVALATRIYRSSDYSQDGQVVPLQKATVGRGVNIVILGDGFVDKDLEQGGAFEQGACKAMETLFCWEPFKTLRDRFNIYAVKAVSANNIYGWTESERAFSFDVDGRIAQYDLRDKTLSIAADYASGIPNPYNTPITVIIIYNTDIHTSRASCAGKNEYENIGSICFVYYLDALGHEVGHGLAGLWDEYIVSDEGDLTQEDRDFIDLAHSQGKAANIDWRNDPATVCWSHFLSDPRYADERLGVYQGASYSATSLFKPTECSTMKESRTAFNAPSREAIYKHVMLYSEGDSWVYDYETFVKVDAGGREQWVSHLNQGGYPEAIELPE